MASELMALMFSLAGGAGSFPAGDDEPAKAHLSYEVPVVRFGGPTIRMADADGDGKLDVLVLQAPGQLQCSEDGWGRRFPEDRKVYCLTAATLQGKVLWQDGEPDRRPDPFISHGAGDQMVVGDIDGDGKGEVAVVRMDELRLLDLSTGKVKRAVKLPADNFVRLSTARFGGRGLNLILKNNDTAHAPWDYANPVLILGPDLSVVRGPFRVPGAGHNVVARDLDGDGADDLFVGYSRLDARGNTVWSIDLGPGFNYAGDHADHINLADLDGDGNPEILYSGSEDFFVADMNGKVRFKVKAGHSQTAIAGRFAPGEAMTILMSEKNRGIWGLTADGKVNWNKISLNGYARGPVRWCTPEGKPVEWVVFRPQIKPSRKAPFESDPGQCRGLWPQFLDAKGDLHDVLPWKEEYAMSPQTIRADRSYDCGFMYDFHIQDLDGDGRDEIVVFNRFAIRVFAAAPGGK